MVMAEVTSNTAVSEDKSYYDIKPNGKGHVRQIGANPSSGISITMDADFSWKYLGANRWVVTLPPLSEYRVTSANNINLGSRPSYSMTVRYFDGNLYEVAASEIAAGETRKVWVPADAEHVGAMAQRLRSQPTLINIDNQQ